MARADGTSSPQQILIALLGYPGTGNRDVQPSLPRGTAFVGFNKTSIWEHWDFIAWGTGLKNILGFCRGQGYKQNRQISPPGSQQLSHQCLTATLHPGTPPQLNCPELCPRACPVPNPGDEQVSDQSHGLLSQQQELSVPVHPSP